jgi:cation diffusion facilitator CzcD-associated flavoprotein CzcO
MSGKTVGGGHNGLALAAQLNAIGVDNLVIDKQSRVGDNWRLRYKSLSLQLVFLVSSVPPFNHTKLKGLPDSSP